MGISVKFKKLCVGIFFITAFVSGYPQTKVIISHQTVECQRVEVAFSTVSHQKEDKITEETEISFETESFKEPIEYIRKIDFRFVSSPPRASPTV